MKPFTYTRARDLDEAFASHRAGLDAAFLAGGTTLLDLAKLQVMQPARVVDINRIGLAEVSAFHGGLRIGALVRNSDLARHPEVRARYPVISEAILSGASAQIRNQATTAGNLLQRTRCPYYRDAISACNRRSPGSGCAALEGYNRSHAILGGSTACVATHPSDFCVALAALEARVEIRGPSADRTVPFAGFHLLPGRTPDREHALEPGELITAVVVPAPLQGGRSWYLKLRDRESFEFALASAAVVLAMDGGRIREARVALGGIGTVPWRSPEAEAVLRGAPADARTFRQAAEAAVHAARPLAHNGFKVELAKRVLVRTLSIVAEGQPAPRRT